MISIEYYYNLATNDSSIYYTDKKNAKRSTLFIRKFATLGNSL